MNTTVFTTALLALLLSACSNPESKQNSTWSDTSALTSDKKEKVPSTQTARQPVAETESAPQQQADQTTVPATPGDTDSADSSETVGPQRETSPNDLYLELRAEDFQLQEGETD